MGRDLHLCVFWRGGYIPCLNKQALLLFTSGGGSNILDYYFLSPIMAEVVLSQAQNQVKVPLV